MCDERDGHRIKQYAEKIFFPVNENFKANNIYMKNGNWFCAKKFF